MGPLARPGAGIFSLRIPKLREKWRGGPYSLIVRSPSGSARSSRAEGKRSCSRSSGLGEASKVSRGFEPTGGAADRGHRSGQLKEPVRHQAVAVRVRVQPIGQQVGILRAQKLESVEYVQILVAFGASHGDVLVEQLADAGE